ncbi:MAG: dockerin type I domain-containing protein [Pirellula sp.]
MLGPSLPLRPITGCTDTKLETIAYQPESQWIMRKYTSRKLILENLESRLAMDSSWQNPNLPNDVDESHGVNPLDVLRIINEYNRTGFRILPESKPSNELYCDVNGDQRFDPTDILAIINAINRTRQPMFVQSSVDTAQDLNRNGVVLSHDVVIRGRTNPLSFVDFTDPSTQSSFRISADTSGIFDFSLRLPTGVHDIAISAMDEVGRLIPMVTQVRVGTVVQEWNNAALNAIRDWRGVTDDPAPGTRFTSEPPKVARNLAMIQGAMFDAINAITPEYESFLVGTVPQSGLHPDIAASAAAFRVAKALYTDKELPTWQATFDETLREFAMVGALQSSIEFGFAVGDAMLQARSNDGSDAVVNYVPGNQPGDWNRTPPPYLAPFLPQWPDVTPFAMLAPDQFLPPPPPALDSPAYAEAVDEVMRLGSKISPIRTEDQTAIAFFWADGGGTFTPPGHWNRIAADITMNNGLTLLESARVLTLLNVALADAGISCWDAKYEYALWRPISAIRAADSDGNPATVQDVLWTPLLVTPPFPAYTSGHSTFSGAAAQILTELFGAGFSFATQQDVPTNIASLPYDASKWVTRSFTDFYDAADEASWSRVYGGIHYLFDGTEGLTAGYSIGSLVYHTQLRPLAT